MWRGVRRRRLSPLRWSVAKLSSPRFGDRDGEAAVANWGEEERRVSAAALQQPGLSVGRRGVWRVGGLRYLLCSVARGGERPELLQGREKAGGEQKRIGKRADANQSFWWLQLGSPLFIYFVSSLTPLCGRDEERAKQKAAFDSHAS